MAEREVLTLNESTPQVLAPQSGDTYKMPRSLSVTGNISVTGTVDGRDVSVDGTKLDGIEAAADVTDLGNVQAALVSSAAVTVAASDVVYVLDVSASPQVIGETTAQAIANLAPAPEGTAILSGGSPLVTDGYVLTATGAGTAAWEAPSVSKVGTPVDNELAIWTGDGTIEGNVNLTWNAVDTALNVVRIDGLMNINPIYGDLTIKVPSSRSFILTDSGGLDQIFAVNELGSIQVAGGIASITNTTSNGSIHLVPNGTGNVKLGTFTINADQVIGAGNDNHVLTYDHADGTIGLEVAPTANATHTGEVTGSAALTVQPASIANRTGVTVASGDQLLVLDVSDSPNTLKRISASDFATAAQANATHSGDASGATALTLQPAAITGKGAVTAATGDLLLALDISASPQVLAQVTAQSVANLAPAVQGAAVLSSHGSPVVTDGYVLTATGSGTAAWEAQEAIYSAHVATVADQEYVLTFDAPFAGTITTARTKTESGTCTVTGEIDDVNLGGTANSASSVASEQAHASANTYAKGAKIAFTVSANATGVDLEVTLYGVRTA